MLKKISYLCVVVLLVCACNSSTNFRASRKRVTQGIDYSHYGQREAYYEFTSAGPQNTSLTPSVTGAETTEETLGEDEDFTSENNTDTYNTYGDVVVTAATRKFKLGPEATRREMSTLMKAMDTAYAQALRTYHPSGFTYAMSSVGAVNPLSDVEVNCRMSEHSANNMGQAACTLFFNTIRTEYVKRLKGEDE